jgi:hypothetical protein
MCGEVRQGGAAVCAVRRGGAALARARPERKRETCSFGSRGAKGKRTSVDLLLSSRIVHVFSEKCAPTGRVP